MQLAPLSRGNYENIRFCWCWWKISCPLHIVVYYWFLDCKSAFSTVVMLLCGRTLFSFGCLNNVESFLVITLAQEFIPPSKVILRIWQKNKMPLNPSWFSSKQKECSNNWIEYYFFPSYMDIFRQHQYSFILHPCKKECNTKPDERTVCALWYTFTFHLPLIIFINYLVILI